MADENRNAQNNSAESTVKSAAKVGKAVSNITRGAATGGIHGAALETAKASKKWILALVGIILIPILIVAMLPSVIFGSLLGDGTETANGISDNAVLTQNMVDLNTGISTILSEGLTDVLDRIDDDFAASGCDAMEVNNPYGSDVVFNANYFVALYCASKDTDAASISKSDMESVLRSHKDKLYSFSFTDEVRQEEGEIDEATGVPEVIETTVRVYEIIYNGEAYFADEVFALSDDQKNLASNYAQNLSVFLSDGVYQALSETDFAQMGISYDGVVFTDGSTQVTYYNQLDDRWRYLPYGTDDIGGYACGPTAMSIVVSSLTSETVDPHRRISARSRRPLAPICKFPNRYYQRLSAPIRVRAFQGNNQAAPAHFYNRYYEEASALSRTYARRLKIPREWAAHLSFQILRIQSGLSWCGRTGCPCPEGNRWEPRTRQ